MDDDGKLSASAANLPDDVIVYILSRLPVRPLCRCKCVSRAWRDLISHPDHRRRLAQTVSGFFYHLHVDASCPPIPYWHFFSSTACASPPGGAHVVDPAFPFLPSSFSRTETELLDSCNGLLLLRCGRASPSPSSSSYVVCNPATGKWVDLPAPTHAPGTFGLMSDYLHGRRRTRLAALAFDPAVSSTRFHVFQLVERDNYPYPFLSQYRFVVEAVDIYSSETNRWVLSGSTEWSCQVACTGQQATYHDGALHFAVDDGGVMSVDTSGEAWRLTHVFLHSQQETLGGGGEGFVGRSQGRLLYVHKGSRYASLSVYSLDRRRGWGPDAEQWTLKHYASPLDQFGKTLFMEHDGVVAVHPDGDVIFLFDACRGMLMAYDMVRRTLRDIQPLAQASSYYPFFPYVPLHSSEALAG